MTKDAGEAMAELEAAGRRFDFVRLTRTLTLTLTLAVALTLTLTLHPDPNPKYPDRAR